MATCACIYDFLKFLLVYHYYYKRNHVIIVVHKQQLIKSYIHAPVLMANMFPYINYILLKFCLKDSTQQLLNQELQTDTDTKHVQLETTIIINTMSLIWIVIHVLGHQLDNGSRTTRTSEFELLCVKLKMNTCKTATIESWCQAVFVTHAQYSFCDVSLFTNCVDNNMVKICIF